MATLFQLAEFALGDAGVEIAPPLKADPGTLGLGSRNLIGFGLKNRRAFKGLNAVGGKTGSRTLVNANGVTAGLADITGTEAKGSVDVYLRNTIWFMGFGQLMYDGAAISGATASTTQKVLVRYNGSLTSSHSGPFDAGLPQPSRPDVAARDSLGSGFTGKMTGTRSYMIASIRSWTGDRSRASYVSATISGDGKSDRLTFPSAPVGGTGWVIFAPKLGFGGVGVHFRLRAPNVVDNREFLESDIERSVTDVVTNSSTTITSATAAFHSSDIGKHVELVNGMTTFTSTIADVTNSTTAILADAVSFTASAVAATFTAYVDGILRTVEIEYDDTDLVQEAAWIADFPPPAGTYSFPLVDVRVVGGCLGDAVSDPTVSDAGTCLAVSERNYPGSYDPVKLLYIPEKFVSALGRPTDQHCFIFGENWTGAVQYTGSDQGPAATVSTVWADTGFKKAQNACLAYGRLYGFSSKGLPVRLQNAEEPDTAFAEKVLPIFESWDPANAVCDFVPQKNAVMYAHGREAWLFYIHNEQWLPAVYLSDFAAGTCVSAQPIGTKLYLTMKNGSTFTLYTFDEGSGSVCTALTNYVGAPAVNRTKTIQEVAETVNIDDITKSYYISLHRNARRCSVNDAATTSASDVVTSATADFTSEDLGKYVIIFGAGAAGVPLLGRIGTVTNSTTIRLVAPTHPLGSAATLNAGTSITSGHMIIADLIYGRTPGRKGSQHHLSPRLNFRNCFSYAVGISIVSTGVSASPISVSVAGFIKEGRAGKASK